MSEAAISGGVIGMAMGMVMAPLAAWTLMRRVPIWRAIAETAAGTVGGAIIGLVFERLLHTVWFPPELLSIAGFALAAIRLRLRRDVGERRIDARAG